MCPSMEQKSKSARGKKSKQICSKCINHEHLQLQKIPLLQKCQSGQISVTQTDLIQTH